VFRESDGWRDIFNCHVSGLYTGSQQRIGQVRSLVNRCNTRRDRGRLFCSVLLNLVLAYCIHTYTTFQSRHRYIANKTETITSLGKQSNNSCFITDMSFVQTSVCNLNVLVLCFCSTKVRYSSDYILRRINHTPTSITMMFL